MSATVYRVLKWCSLNPDEITKIVKEISHGFVYDGKDFYNEVEKRNAWDEAGEEDDDINVWREDDAGPISVNGKEVGLFIHFDEEENKYDWACVYEI